MVGSDTGASKSDRGKKISAREIDSYWGDAVFGLTS